MNVRQLVQDILCKGGIQEATGFEVRFKTGEVVTFHSDDHPALNRDAEEVEAAVPKQSASGG